MTINSIGTQKMAKKTQKASMQNLHIISTYSVIYEDMVKKAKQFGLIAGHSFSSDKRIK